MQNSEGSAYYENSAEGVVEYKNIPMSMEWFGEMFGSVLPTQENTFMRKGPGGNMVYWGKDIGRVYYVVVLIIANPFFLETPGDIDYCFEKGEESHTNDGTDGTILYHPEGVSGRYTKYAGTDGSFSYAVFDPNNIRIIGREINGDFQLMPNFAEK